MKEHGRCTGRTKRMVLMAVTDILDPEVNIVYLVGYNMFMARELLRQVEQIIIAMNLEHTATKSQQFFLEVLDTEVYAISEHRVLMEKIRFSKNLRYSVYKDHFVKWNCGRYPIWKPVKTETTWVRLVNKFWSLIP